jgi:proteasome lid subunit RPN8/RPN11
VERPTLTFTFSSILVIHDQVKCFPTLETGGLLFGRGDEVLYAVAANNEAADQGSEYAISAEAFAKHVESFEEEDYELIGTYHSHPNGNAQMSGADVAMAQQTGKLLIVAPGQAWEWRLYDPIWRLYEPIAGGEVPFVIAPPRSLQP